MRRLYRKLAFNYSEGGLGRLLQKSFSFTLSTLYSESLWNIYIHKGFDDLGPSEPLLQCKTLTYQDLLDAQYYKVVAFPEEIRQRFDRRNTCYGFYLNKSLATIGWSSDGYLELDRGVVFPCPSEVALFDFMTLPEFRGRGIYTNALRYLINSIPKSSPSSIYIAVDPNDAASVKGIRRAGFSPLLSLSRRKILGVAFNSRHPAQSNRFAAESAAR
jgi:hypothetical protein